MAFCVAGAHFAGVGIWIQRLRSARAGRHDTALLARTAALAHTRGASRGWRIPHDAAGLRVAWLRHCPFCVRAGVFQEQTNSHFLSGRPNKGSLARARSPRLHCVVHFSRHAILFSNSSRGPHPNTYALDSSSEPTPNACSAHAVATHQHISFWQTSAKHPCFPRKTSVRRIGDMLGKTTVCVKRGGLWQNPTR